jgi:serine phosphatase RsbU (regulator of sigma subunit)
MSQIRSMMAVPLQTEDRVIGLIYLDSSHFVKEFTKQDLSLLTVMANMAAVRIENARLAEVEQAERVRARELEHAAMIQRSMLPSQFPPFPERTDFELHAAMVPAKEVGGDLFDFFLLDQDRLGFVVGDVSGKGVPAALFMAIARTLLRAAAHHEASPGACLTYMNQSLVEQHASGMFVTLFYGILNLRNGALEYSNAGHTPPYAFSRDGQRRPLKERCGPMLGIFEGFQYATRNAQIHPGEGVLVYTDGVTEAHNKAGEFYEDARLEAYLESNAARPVEELVRGLHAEVERFEAGAARGAEPRSGRSNLQPEARRGEHIQSPPNQTVEGHHHCGHHQSRAQERRKISIVGCAADHRSQTDGGKRLSTELEVLGDDARIPCPARRGDEAGNQVRKDVRQK